LIRSGVKPQDKVTQKGFRRIEQALTDVDERKYSPEKDILPVKDVNLGSEKNRFKKIYVDDVDASANSVKIGEIVLSSETDTTGHSLKVKGTANTLKLGDLVLSQEGIGDNAQLKINNTSTATNPGTTVSANNITNGTGDVNLKSNQGTITIEQDGPDSENQKDIDFKVTSGNRIEFWVGGASQGYFDSSGFSGASGGGVVTSGTDTPSSVSDKTPNNGDMYIQYTESAGDGVTDSYIGYNENSPIIFIRDSDERLLEIKPHSSTSGYLKMSEKYDTATAIGNPRCNSQKFVTSGGGTTEPSSYQLVGTTTTVYARVTYADVTGDIDNGMPRMEFKNNWGGNSSAYADLDGTNKLYTTVSFTAGVSGTGGSRDSHTYCDYAPNTATEDDGSGSNQVPVDDAVASKKIYWRNNKVYGSRHAEDTWSEALSGTGASTCGGGSDPCSVEIETLSSNASYNNIGSVSVTNRLGDQVFFAIPNGTANITSIKISGNPVEQISAFSTTTGTYTNSTNYAETYKIWYTTNPQAESTTTWEVS
tara:strand:+ start:614 stop:2218 length:1605 start_codon:yes stop_codon:yes gene_type:complete